jgi:hypothetical protein
MDDKNNFRFSHSTLAGINGLWTDDDKNTPDAVKYKAGGKFEPKILVWCAISETGVSTSFIGTIKLSMFISPNVCPRWNGWNETSK